MAIYIGTDEMKDIYLGNDKVSEIYLGTDLVYQSVFYALKNGVPQNGFTFEQAKVAWGAGYSVSFGTFDQIDNYMRIGYYGNASGARGGQYWSTPLTKADLYPKYTYLKFTVKKDVWAGDTNVAYGICTESPNTIKSGINQTDQTCSVYYSGHDTEFYTLTFLLANAPSTFRILNHAQTHGSGAANPSGAYSYIKDIWFE